ncbi:MAG: hypothetical protein RR327_05735 [Clostridia bacterium]
MQTNFKISDSLNLRKIETLSIPRKISSFAVSNCNSVNLEFANASGEILAATIQLLPNVFCDSCKIHPVKVSKDCLYIVENKSFSNASSAILGKIELGETTHKLTLLDDEKPKILIESGDKFFTSEMRGKKLLAFYAFSGLILLKFDQEIQLVKFDGDYQLAFSGKYTFSSENDNVLTLTTLTQTIENYEITRKVSVKDGIVEETLANIAVRHRNNYTKATYPIVFFERLKYLPDAEIVPMLSNSFSIDDIPKLKKFIGNFSTVTLVDKACALDYDGYFRSFSLKFKNDLVDNVLEL